MLHPAFSKPASSSPGEDLLIESHAGMWPNDCVFEVRNSVSLLVLQAVSGADQISLSLLRKDN